MKIWRSYTTDENVELCYDTQNLKLMRKNARRI